MFTQITPQKLQHNSGYIVQTGGRYSLQYIDGDLVAEIQVDFATVTGLYPDSMTIRKNAISRIPTAQEREVIFDRIIKALDYWKMKYEICNGKAP
jgi:hypothetical protein